MTSFATKFPFRKEENWHLKIKKLHLASTLKLV